MLTKTVNDKSLSSSNASLNSIETGNHGSNGNDRTVYLGDLDLDMTEKQLMDFFNKSGQFRPNITKIVKQPHSSFAHITCEDPAVAKSLLENAIIRINNKVIRVMPFNQPNNFDPNANLIIKNLESYVNESNIIQKFKEFGDILSCKLVRDDEGNSKCYAFLQFKDKQSAAVAIDKYNNTYWDERCDPDFKFRKYQEKLLYLNNHQSLGKLNEADLQENELFADFSNKMGKKIYVGVFKKRDEYSKIKSDKEGKPSNLYVKNFGTNFGDRDLFNLFKVFGSIKSAKVRRLKVGPIEKPLGCGFVDFENPDEAEEARKALDNYKLPDSGRIISVKYADCKSRRMRKKLEETNETTPSIIQSIVQTPQITHDEINNNLEQLNRKTSTSSLSSSASTSSNTISSSTASSPAPQNICLFSPSPDAFYQNFSSFMHSSSLINNDKTDQYEWPDVWSKLLRTTEWKEYTYF